MKLTKTSWFILALGIFVITFGSLGAARSQRINEANQLQEELAVAEMRLAKLDLTEMTNRQATLQQQIEKAARERDEAKVLLSQPIDSITISDNIFRIAYASGVQFIQIGSASLAKGGSLEKLPNLALPVSVQAQGDPPALIDFVMRLNNEFRTGVVKSVQISLASSAANVSANMTDIPVTIIVDPTSSQSAAVMGGSAGGANTGASATIQLEVYTYKGG